MGHRSEYLLPASEFLDYSAENFGKNKPEKVQKEVHSERNLKKREIASFRESANAKLIQALLEASLDKRLRPLNRSLAKIEQDLNNPSLTEVIGGIGYIFGIVGIILYFKNRKK